MLPASPLVDPVEHTSPAPWHMERGKGSSHDDGKQRILVRLWKPEASSRLGITLVGTGGPPTVSSIAAGCIAAESGEFTVGQRLYAVGGVAVSDHEEATALLRSTVGNLGLTLSPCMPTEVSSPPGAGGTSTASPPTSTATAG